MIAPTGTPQSARNKATARGALRSVQILLPVWGAAYLRQCVEVLLPSLLAAGNLPAVAAAIPVAFILSTRQQDIPAIHDHPAWRALATFCETRLEPLDSLLSEASALVLTLVYARAIRSAGNTAHDVGFVFLVADYVLADGALREVLRRLQGGADAVLAGNFQISAEAAGRRIAAPAPGEALTISPRALVRLGLEALHPATQACLAGEAALHDARANRVFWRAGRDALLGRFYLLHMIAIRPVVLDVCIAAACDYSFVPEFCPSGQIETITDSDSYMVAEMQPAGAGPQDWRVGPLKPAALAASLASWVTPQHRRNAVHPICFHATNLDRFSADCAEAMAESAQFITETQQLLGPVSQPHRHHPSWRGLLEHHQATAIQQVDLAILATILGAGAVPGGLGRMRQLLLGRMPKPRPWHPHWADWRILCARLTALAAGCRVLIVSAENWRLHARLLRHAMAGGARSAAHLDPEALFAAAAESRGARFDFVLAVIRPSAQDGLAGICQAAAALLAEGGKALLALSEFSDAPTPPLAPSQVDAAAALAAPALLEARRETVPAPGWRIAAQTAMMRHARAATQAPSPARRLGHFTAGIACAGLSLAANLACRRETGPSLRLDQGAISTALIHVQRAPVVVVPEHAAQTRQASPWTV